MVPMIEGQEVKWLSKVQERRQKSYLPVTTSAYILFGANTILFGAETKQIRGESKNTFLTSTGVMGILSLLNNHKDKDEEMGRPIESGYSGLGSSIILITTAVK